MKNLYILILLTSICFAANSQQYGWNDISANLPEYANYNDLYVIGEELWITGWNDGLIYSPDGGLTFQIQQLPENSGISSSIFMINNMEGYVVTYHGNILKTENGGTNWTMLHEPGGTLHSVHFPPTLDIGYACGNTGRIYAFTDSSIIHMHVEGLTAEQHSIFFPINSNEGKLCGETTVRRYFNGTWDNYQIFDSTIDYNSIFFTDNNTGWIVGSQGRIFKTVDATVWNGQSSGTSNYLTDVFFIDSFEGWVVGGGVILYTIDGGLNWTQELASQTIGMVLRAIYFTSAHKGYIVGNGVLLKYGEVFGIEENALAIDFEVFPNPCQDIVSIQHSALGTQHSEITIIDITGCVVKSMELQGQETTIDVGDLPAGVYFIKLQTEDGVGVQKLIKK